jgi:hypothetical protein
MASAMCEETALELDGIDLGDKRLNDRAGILIERLAADTAASINASCQGWNETNAAYKFFDNKKVEPQKILRPHREATEKRIRAEKVVLIVQDTTELDYSNHPTKDSGVLNDEHRYGFYDHSHIAFTPEKLCLGVAGVEFYSRTPESLGKAYERRNDPIEAKESFRWLKGYRLACELADTSPTTQIVSVADRECDIYDIFLETQEHDTPADFVIRAKYDRQLSDQDSEAGIGTNAYCSVMEEVATSPLVTTRQIDLPRTPKRQSRQATLEIRAMQVRVQPPGHRLHLDEVTYNVVLVEEVGGPGDGTDVCWLLMTSLPIDSVKSVMLVLDYYVARWPIEVFFRVFKTGCRVEDIQLETNRRLMNCLMFYKVIAWRIMYVTFLGREYPDMACDEIFADVEWKPVWKIVSEEPLPKKAPSLSVFIPMLAELGGYNNRSTDHPPGPQAIWVGIRRMTDFAIAWTAFGPKDDR